MSDSIGSLRIDLGLEMVQFMQKMREAQTETVAATSRMAEAAGTARRAIESMAAGLAAFSAAEALRGIAEATIKFQSYQYTLDAATQSQADAAREMQFVLATAQKFGINLDATAQAYSRMAFEAGQAGMKTQQLRELFTNVSGAMRVLHLDQTHTKAAFLALQEIMGQTFVQTRHLTKQLSIDFPGALQAAAKGMGITTGQMLEMARAGRLTSQDFFGGLNRGLQEMFGAQFQEASSGAQAAFERMHTSWMAMENAIGKSGLVDVMTSFANGVSDVARAFGAFRVQSEHAARSGADFGAMVRYVGILAAGAWNGLQQLGRELSAWGTIALNTFEDLNAGNFAKIGRDYNTVSKSFQKDLEDINAQYEKTRHALLNPLPAVDPNKLPIGNLKGGSQFAKALQEQMAVFRSNFEEQTRSLSDNTAAPIKRAAEQYRKEVQSAAELLSKGTITGPEYGARVSALHGAYEHAVSSASHSGMGRGHSAAVRALEEHRSALVAFKQQMDGVINQLSSTGNPVFDHYQSTMRQIAKAAEEASRKGLTFAETNDRIAHAVRAAQQQMATEQAAFRKQFDQQTIDLVAQTKGAIAQAANQYQKDVAAAAQVFQSGQISLNEYSARLGAVRDQYDKTIAESRKSRDAMTQYAQQAARNIQDSFANFLIDPFKHGLKGMLTSFADTVQQMMAQAAAAKLLSALFGGTDANGKQLAGAFGSGGLESTLGGLFGALAGSGSGSGAASAGAGWLASLFGGARASGGAVSPDRSYLVGEHGPELFKPNTGGQIVPNHVLASASGPVIHQYFTVQAPESRISRQTDLQLRTSAGMAVRHALARNG